MSTIFQQATAFPPAPASPPPSSPLLWIPLDEVRQAWASFGAEALSCPALLATSNAFLALSWETSALRHHRLAGQAQQRGLSQEAARWLSQAVQDLAEAVRDWCSVLLWLERLGQQRCANPQRTPGVRARTIRAGGRPAAAALASRWADAARTACLLSWTGDRSRTSRH